MDGIAEKMVTVYCGCCPMCGKDNYVNVRETDYLYYCDNPRSLVNDVFPYLSEDDRELMISGVCSDCWDEIFPDEEEDM